MIGENIYIFNTLAIVTKDLKNYLSKMEYSIFHVNDFIEIEHQLQYSQPDLIIFELFTLSPEITNMIEKIKTYPEFEEVPKIAMCHRKIRSLILLLEQVGFNEILTTPFDNNSLGNAIERHIVPYLKTYHLDDGSIYLECQNKLDLGNAAKIENHINGLIQQGQRNIIFDLHKVETVDSSGIGMLVVLNKRLMKNGGMFKIANLNERLKYVFLTLHIDKLLKIVEMNIEKREKVQVAEPTGYMK